ncbi:hypothetical protein AXG93_2338s1050 [Marchantia polymorpha subsp. ruderalis]|uniref:Uncharacterized protein n=1 Tax=Marchantia polymorpha subsp. ruderalis TaxID=1480154 RepID=A0A176VKM1_MARPO|nr:hypothetical protein AXG93_2338s1050 [Marchantia polymorpha subsp. ruderalis]
MDPHMTHYKALRRHMNEHEDKIDALTTEQHEKQTIIDLLKQDLKAVREETARLELAIKLRSKESDQLSNSTKECRRSLAEREESRRALADALRVLKEETKNRSARLTERKLYFEKLVSSTRSELEKWIEGTTIPVATKPRLEETLKELQSQYHELVMITPRLEANLLRLKTEKTAEEEFIVSLTERLTQLKPCLLPIGGQKQARLTPASSLFVLLASAFKDVIRLYYEIRRDFGKMLWL